MSAPRKPKVERCGICRKALHDGTPTTVVGEAPVYRPRPGYHGDTGRTAPVVWHTACAERYHAEDKANRERYEAEWQAELAEARREIERQRNQTTKEES